jgi:ankyrin repeat protein
LDVVKYLVKNGADFKTCNNYAVRHASENGHLDVVKFLVELGSTACSSTCPNGDKVEKGADFKADKNYAVRFASKSGHSNVVKYLLDKGATMN